jgi:hypothetical protein
MTQPATTAAPDYRLRATILLAVVLSATLAGACHQGPPPESSGIPGFEPTIQSVPIGQNEHFSVIDSNEVIVASRDRSLIGGIFLLVDDAQLPYRRYFQKLPPRTAVAMLIQPGDSIAMDSVIKASKAPIVVYEHVNIPRDAAGNPLPIARFLVASVRNKVARKWVLAEDTAGGPPIPDWIIAGATQLVTGFPSAGARNAQLASQLNDLIPIDTLIRMSINENAIPAGVSGDVGLGGIQRRDQRGRPVGLPQTPPKKLPRENIAALEAASLMEFMWAREGRGIVRKVAQITRRGEPLSAALVQTQSLPHDVPGLEAAWKASLTPPKNTDKKGEKKPSEKPSGN